MNLQEKLYCEGRRTINAADRWYSETIAEYLELKNTKSVMSQEEYEDISKKIGTKFGLICEYYLKGLLLPHLDITVPTSENDLQTLVNQLSNDDKYRLIINDDTIIEELLQKFSSMKLNKAKIQKLQGESLIKFGHSIKKMIGTLTLDDNILFSKISPAVRKQIYKEMRFYFYPLFVDEQISISDLEQRIATSKKEFLTYDNSTTFSPDTMDPIVLAKLHKYEEVISSKEISDAFPKSRYGHLNEYTPDIDALFYLAQGIRRSIKLEYNNAVTISDSNDFDDISFAGSNSVKFIFPDIDSKIYVLDGNNDKVTRVYDFKKYVYDDSWIIDAGKEIYTPQLVDGLDILFKSFTDGLTKEEIMERKEWIKSLILDDPRPFICLKNGFEEASLLYYSENKPQALSYRNGRIFLLNPEKIQNITSAIERYKQEKTPGISDEHVEKDL